LKYHSFLVVIAAIVVVSCKTAPTPTVATPQGEGRYRYLIDPRTGWKGPPNEAMDRRFDAAWRLILSGDFTNARKRLDEIRARDAGYAPADLAEAAIRLVEGQPEAARAIVDRIAMRDPQYIAAQIYQAEIDLAETRIRSAYDRYREIIQRPDAPPSASSRYAELQTRVFDQLYGAAVNAAPEDAIPLLHEALQVNPTATAARLLLVQKLVALRQFDEARGELDPILNTSAVDQVEVQEALAEIEVGKGQYEEAIIRYERLARGDTSGRYARRLEQVKEQFATANMPPQVLRAMEAEAITRADLAVLMYWKIASIRFAQNVPTPPIVVDISETPGRDEIIRAIALGIYQMDPVTRRINPDTEVNGAALARIAARVLTLRGASCARGVPSDAILSTCGISLIADELPVSGGTATAVLEQVDRAISR
jgi:tetratricopeptide (TPR) repeat protein